MVAEALSKLADDDGWSALAPLPRVRLVQELVLALILGLREDAALVFEEDLS